MTTREPLPQPWATKWLRDETFWRGVTSNVVSGVILAFLIWTLGVAVGLFAPVHEVNHFNWGIEMIGLLLLGFTLYVTLRSLVVKWTRLTFDSKLTYLVFSLAMTCSILLLGMLFISDTAILVFHQYPAPLPTVVP